MSGKMKVFYRKERKELEYCIYLETTEELSAEELEKIHWLLAETFDKQGFSDMSFLSGKNIVEIGPRMNFATAWNTNALSILRACGINKVKRVERARRYLVSEGRDEEKFDRMTECVYPEQITIFETGIVPETVFAVLLMEKGPDVLLEIPGLAMDGWDRQFYYDYFVGKCKRNPTIVELMDLNNANSQHSRHGYFKGRQSIDGEIMPETLMEIVKSTLVANPGNSVLAFCDNSSAIRGYDITTILPKHPGKASAFEKGRCFYHILFTAETHNFPTGIAPFPGAETGTGGRIRDVQATGKGGLVLAGTAAYCVGNLQIAGYELPWEDKSFAYPATLATPLQIEIEASNGASDYGNKFGEPVIQGFTRSFGMRLPSGERREWLKPIMFTGGIGQVEDGHLKKGEAEKGLLIVQIGGPAYRIGFGGASASSLLQGENKEGLDFNAVQRGDAEMEQKMNRVVRACVEMGSKNPIISIHDQGAGGPANVLKELVEKSGGRIELRKIVSGDPTLSTLEIWVCEYQERNGLLIHPDRIEEFLAICRREKVNCEVLGEATDDGIFVVHDSRDDSMPVHLHLDEVLGNMPQKEFKDNRVVETLKPIELPKNISIRDALERVLRLVSVGSKRFLTSKVDRSVTGLIAQQQCCGPLQLTVADVAVVAQSHFGKTGAAMAIGEQPIKILVNPKAGARMAVGEMLTNLVWARWSGLSDIKCSGNWMWAPKLPGEGAKLYDAACAARDLMVKLGIAIDGGKDSLSMATKVALPGGTTEIVKSPGELVVSGYVTVPDIEKVVTPDLKGKGYTRILFIDLANGKNRLGGSALAQCWNQIGNEAPDVEYPVLLKKALYAVQQMLDEGLILSGHDRSDGGLITAILEMAFSGNCGLYVTLGSDFGEGTIMEKLFSEELGLIIECQEDALVNITAILKEYNLPFEFLGHTMPKASGISIMFDSEEIFREEMPRLRALWEETSYQLDRLQADPDCVDEEKRNIYDRPDVQYHLAFKPEPTRFYLTERSSKPKVAIIREEGSNGDREMTSAFFMAGLEPWDVTMTDLLEGAINLSRFRGIAFVGGFSYGDVLDSGKGWVGGIRFNEKLREMFDAFRKREDTFSFSVCNGCQAMALLGWVPWEGISDDKQPRFIRNLSQRFESRWSAVKILPSPAIMLKGMEDSQLGIWVAHGEGRLYLPDPSMLKEIESRKLAPIRYVDDLGEPTEQYPFNPNDSPLGITALCTPDGRHLTMMPHPERTFLKWQWAWMPEKWKKELKASPWLKMFQNAREWCER